ncbi:hypothetical protein G4D82_12305 [Flavobacterium sp. CYK-4]|uniref:hypothetical protein n=1 Tax=Flavobacterium lotistagni TaxID=2709660 RepID=UPI00140E1CBD|nr:hypothetical protein [Flavobacterium lotistagni]NHM08008.1 hypothetical protein [Flavobacterium lotistagni]
MKKVIIEFGAHKFALQFDFFTFLKISELWEVEGMTALGQKIASFITPDGDFTLRSYAYIADICFAAAMIENPESEVNFDKKECQKYLFENPAKIQEIMVAFYASMPVIKSVESGKYIAAKVKK